MKKILVLSNMILSGQETAALKDQNIEIVYLKDLYPELYRECIWIDEKNTTEEIKALSLKVAGLSGGYTHLYCHTQNEALNWWTHKYAFDISVDCLYPLHYDEIVSERFTYNPNIVKKVQWRSLF